MNSYEQKGAMALDNKRKVMRSNIFGDDDSSSIPISYQPNKNKYYESDYENGNNDRYTSQKPSYQNNANSVSGNYQPSTFQKQGTYSTSLVNDSPVYIPQIEQIEIPPSLPALTPFPDFRFDSIAPIGQIDLGVRPKDSFSNIHKQNEKSYFNPAAFNVGGALQKIRDDLTQESANSSKKMQQLLANNQNLQLNVDKFRVSNNSTLNNDRHSQNNDFPYITTSSQFVFPDGTTVQNS